MCSGTVSRVKDKSIRAAEKSFIPIRNALGYRILGIRGSIEHKREQNQ